MTEKFRAVHYTNQFFAQIGGEEKADIKPFIKEETVGPGKLLQNFLGDRAEIVATVICGDTYFAENIDAVVPQITEIIASYKPDFVVAGPAFASGRLGIACGAVCSSVMQNLGIPALSGMSEENPGLEMYRKNVYIVQTSGNARTMGQEMKKIADLGLKLAGGEETGSPEEEGYYARGFKKNVFCKVKASTRAIDMILAKYHGRPFTTEIPLPKFDRIDAAEPLTALKDARIALVTDGGLVPLGNPDGIEMASATKWGYYSIEGLDRLEASDYEVVHRGYDNTFVRENPNRLVPVDAMRIIEKRGMIGCLHHHYFATTGLITSLENSKRMGKEIAEKLINDKVNGVLLTST